MSSSCRRVVSATAPDGRSVIAGDEAVPVVMGGGPDDPIALSIIWEAAMPVDYGSMGGPVGETFTPFPVNGAVRLVRLDVAARGSGVGHLDIDMHRSDTLDLLYVASGTIEFVVDSGSVRLTAGDHLVMQGDVHGWRNVGDVPCVLIVVLIGAPERADRTQRDG